MTGFGIPEAELDAIIDEGIAFRTSGCPGKFRDDVSACDRPYGDSPPSNIASYPVPAERGRPAQDPPPAGHGVRRAYREQELRQERVSMATVPRHRHRRPRGPRQIAFDQAMIERTRRAASRHDPLPALSADARWSAATRRFAPGGRSSTTAAPTASASRAGSPAAARSTSTRASSAGSWCSRRSALGHASLGDFSREHLRGRGGRAVDGSASTRATGPRNDIEVDGRKISGTGGFFDGDTLFYQGTVLVDVDPGAHGRGLNVPRGEARQARARLGGDSGS